MADELFIDVDTHITEPPDTWSARVPARFRDQVPYVERNKDGRDYWYLQGRRISNVGLSAVAGFDGGPFPDSPKGFDDVHRASWDADARLAYMDSVGIWAQVLYPNVGGFGSQVFLQLEDPASSWPASRPTTTSRPIGRAPTPAAFCRWRPRRSGTSRRPPTRSGGARRRATAACSSPASPRSSASPSSATITGTPSGPRPRSAACPSASTWARGTCRPCSTSSGWPPTARAPRTPTAPSASRWATAPRSPTCCSAECCPASPS